MWEWQLSTYPRTSQTTHHSVFKISVCLYAWSFQASFLRTGFGGSLVTLKSPNSFRCWWICPKFWTCVPEWGLEVRLLGFCSLLISFDSRLGKTLIVGFHPGGNFQSSLNPHRLHRLTFRCNGTLMPVHRLPTDELIWCTAHFGLTGPFWKMYWFFHKLRFFFGFKVHQRYILGSDDRSVMSLKVL